MGDAAIDLFTALVVTINRIDWNNIQIEVLYPHGATLVMDPESLVSLSAERRHDAYKTWCLNAGRLDLWEAFMQVEADIQHIPTLEAAPVDDNDKDNMLVDCGHVTAEPWRCPECQELLCTLCREAHNCTELGG